MGCCRSAIHFHQEAKTNNQVSHFFLVFFQVENQSSYSTRWQWISYRRLVTKNRCQVTSCLINLDTRGSLIGHRTQRPSRRFVLLIYSVVSSDISPLLGFDMKIWTFFCPSNLAPIFPLHRPVRILISILCFTYSSVREMLAYHVILFLTNFNTKSVQSIELKFLKNSKNRWNVFSEKKSWTSQIFSCHLKMSTLSSDDAGFWRPFNLQKKKDLNFFKKSRMLSSSPVLWFIIISIDLLKGRRGPAPRLNFVQPAAAGSHSRNLVQHSWLIRLFQRKDAVGQIFSSGKN